MSEQFYVEMKDICKSFGSVAANKGATFQVKKGEIHALLGENGSGKSTLMNMLSGVYAPDSGSICINGKAQVFHSPKDAIEAGVGMVYQHFKLVDVLTARENIVAGSREGFFIQRKKLEKKITAITKKYGLTLQQEEKIYNLSVGEKQTVEIVKMLYRGADILILDEPTAVLTPQETGVLFQILKNMKEQGAAIIIITHKLNEVMDISDRVTVLRKGESVGTVNTCETNPQALTELMVGRSVQLEITREAPVCSKEPILKIENLSKTGLNGRNVLSQIDFSIYGGEIVGMAGIAGSGQKELCEIIAGLDRANQGQVIFKGENILGLSPIVISKKGVSMSFVPEDRLGMGLVAGMDITNNILLRSFQQKNSWFVDRAAGKKKAEEIVEKYNVSTPSVGHVVKKLSGGNIQKVLLGREVDRCPELLITAYPVRGLDIGASYHVYDILNQQKKAGVGVLYIGEDLDVLLALCDRLMVIHDGEIMGMVDPKTTTKEEIGLLMLGQSLGEELA